jgi:hypothetical protein
MLPNGMGTEQPVEYAQDDQGDQALGRGRQVRDHSLAMAQQQRPDDTGPVGAQVADGHRAASRLKVGGDAARQIAAVEVVEAGLRQPGQRRGERRLPE